MEIELGGDLKHLDVIEFTLRDMKLFSSAHGESKLIPHFQARIKIDEKAKESYFDCDLSYYGQDNEFLGITETHSNKKRSITNEPRVISAPLDIPEGTTKVVARFTEDIFLKSIRPQIAKFLGWFFVLIILGSGAVYSVLSIFS